MKQIAIGKSGMTASAIGLGSWAIGGGTWWGKNDDAQSVKTIQTAIDRGVSLIDTAPAYGFGHSEEVVGQALKGRRDKVILSTKCGLWWHDDEGPVKFEKEGYTVRRNLTKRCIDAEVEYSLRRLDTDYIDIYITHWQSIEEFPVPIEETMGALVNLKKQGKIRGIGLSNVTPAIIEEYLRYGAVDVVQQRYSMVNRDIEKDILPLCEKHGITFQAYSPMEQGLLTGKYDRSYQLKQGEARANEKWWRPENRGKILDLIAGWGDLCDKYECSLLNLVVAWTVAQGNDLSVLCGARSIPQIEEIVRSGGLALSAEDIARIRCVVEAVD